MRPMPWGAPSRSLPFSPAPSRSRLAPRTLGAGAIRTTGLGFVAAGAIRTTGVAGAGAMRGGKRPVIAPAPGAGRRADGPNRASGRAPWLRAPCVPLALRHGRHLPRRQWLFGRRRVLYHRPWFRARGRDSCHRPCGRGRDARGEKARNRARARCGARRRRSQSRQRAGSVVMGVCTTGPTPPAPFARRRWLLGRRRDCATGRAGAGAIQGRKRPVIAPAPGVRRGAARRHRARGAFRRQFAEKRPPFLRARKG
jgi:hypothetical protein